MRIASRPYLVIISGAGWDGVRGSERQLAEALVSYFDILWVDPPRSPITPHRFLGVEKRRRSWRTTVEDIQPSLTRLRPVVGPKHSHPMLRPLTWSIVRRRVRREIRRRGVPPTAVIACSFDDVLGYWGDDVIDVLYGTDDWVAASELMGQSRDLLEVEERRALGHADVVLAVGPELAERWAMMGARPTVFPNGCAADHFESVDDVEPSPLPCGFPARVAGVVGQLSDRIEIGLLEAVADSGIGLVLVGPRDPGWAKERLSELIARPNVHHTGPVSFAELPRWMAALDVGLVPYADTAFNRASFPLKSLEYLAAGLPVVSTPLPAVRRIGAEPDDVAMARDAVEFAAAVSRLAGRPPERAAMGRRRAIAGAQSWRNRAEQLARILDDHARAGEEASPASRVVAVDQVSVIGPASPAEAGNLRMDEV